MRKKSGNNAGAGGKRRAARRQNDFTVGVESQTFQRDQMMANKKRTCYYAQMEYAQRIVSTPANRTAWLGKTLTAPGEAPSARRSPRQLSRATPAARSRITAISSKF